MKALRLPIRVSTVTYWFAPAAHALLLSFVSRLGAPTSAEVACRPGPFFMPAALLRLLSRGRKWDLSGLQAIHPVSLLRSRTPVESTCPRHAGHVDAAPATRTAKASAILHFGANPQLQHLLPYASRGRCRTRARLASGWQAAPLPGGSRTLWITTKGFSSFSRSSSFPDYPDATGSAVHRATQARGWPREHI
jgi:hypothetical protein